MYGLTDYVMLVTWCIVSHFQHSKLSWIEELEWPVTNARHCIAVAHLKHVSGPLCLICFVLLLV